MKRALSLFFLSVLAGAPLGALRSAEDISAEQLGGFYPSSLERLAISPPGYSHLAIPGFQKASTTRVYEFGGVEITYYSDEDGVFGKKVAKLRPDRLTVERVEQQGFPVVVVTRKSDSKPVKIMADVGGEIAVVVDCANCESRDELLGKLAAFDLQGLGKLLE
ncbi:MAG: hypothetical protein MUP90_08485 [Gammaproteobacteria bacterium]|nr:hypothetical protein [Gammaproteobacteria bacterium]